MCRYSAADVIIGKAKSLLCKQRIYVDMDTGLDSS